LFCYKYLATDRIRTKKINLKNQKSTNSKSFEFFEEGKSHQVATIIQPHSFLGVSETPVKSQKQIFG
jgi:hypothetical protein